MITTEKLKLYLKFRGNTDLWVHCASKKERNQMDESNWHLIDDFLQDIELTRQNLTSISYKELFEKRVLESYDNNETIDYLKTTFFNSMTAK